VVDNRHVDSGRRHSDPAGVSGLQVLGRRVGPERFRLHVWRNGPAPAAEAVLRPLVDGRTMDLAALAATAGLDVEDAAGLVQELVAGQAATAGSLL
jgi:hypothetical protein